MEISPKYVFLLMLAFLTENLLAQKYFTWTDELKTAYAQTTSLRFKAAEKSLQQVADSDPDNLLRLHVENYLDFFKVYINEEKSEFELLEKNKDRRLSEIEKNGDKNSPYYLYLQADIRLQWALARLKFEEYATAFFETNKAYKLLSENVKKFPDFLPNKKDLGILHAMVGTIPDNYKWAIDWFSSLEGTIDEGKGELEEVIEFAKNHDFIYEEEIYVYYAYLMLHLDNDSEAAWRIINTANLSPKKNPMACFLKANVAMRTDRGDEAISILENRPLGAEFHPFPYLDYMLGIAKLQRLDEDACVYLLRFIEHYHGRNFIKDAYQKLAWSHLILGKKDAYHSYMELCITRGNTVVGSDQSAMNEATKGEIPSIELLKARLLFDGGRFDKAYALLKDKQSSDFFSQKNRLEYNYRLGRILQKLGRPEEALSYYHKTIEMGSKEPWYFACRSALEQGIIYEEMGQKAMAQKAYSNCLDISPEDHKTGLHQQAKAGLRRIKN
jgi:tetratricopeptide (TPR) repeat protein